jgi:hypothetical protein
MSLTLKQFMVARGIPEDRGLTAEECRLFDEFTAERQVKEQQDEEKG